MSDGWQLLVFLGCFWLAIRPLTVFIHEMGHAVVAALFGSKNIQVYVGTNGSQRRTFSFTLGRFTFWLHKNPLAWQQGVVHQENTGYWANLFTVLAGPFASIVIASIFAWLVFAVDLNDLFKLLAIAFCISGVIDLVINIIPNNTPYVLADGSTTYNDGRLLLQIISQRQQFVTVKEMLHHVKAGNHALAAEEAEWIIKTGKAQRGFYAYCIGCYLEAGNHAKAAEIGDLPRALPDVSAMEYTYLGTIDFHQKNYQASLDNLNKALSLNTEDYSAYVTRSLAHCFLGHYDEAVADANTAIALQPNNALLYSNRAYVFVLKGLHVEAVADATQAIKLDDGLSYAYNNRGYAKIKLGLLDAGLADVERAIRLQPGGSYSYLVLGIYYWESGDAVSAKLQFLKAKELDPDTYELDKYLALVEDVAYHVG